MRLDLRITTLLLMLAGIATAVPPGESEPTPASRNRFDKGQLVRRMVSKGAIAGAVASAAVGEANGTPHEWGRGITGFGKRLGSAFAGHSIKSGIQFSVAYVRHEQLGYRPSGKQGLRPRLTYALMSTVITRKTDTGKRTVAAGEISGTLASGLISRLWMPASARTLAAGFSSAGVTLGADAGLNVAREFWPRRRKNPDANALKPPADRHSPQ